MRFSAPSFPSTWLTCFLTVSDGDHELTGDGLVWLARGQHCHHFQFAAGELLDQAGHCNNPLRAIGIAVVSVKGMLEAGQAVQRDLGLGGIAGALRSDQTGQQRSHRGPLVGEDPDIALRAGKAESLRQ